MLNGYNANIRPQYPVYVPQQQQTRTNNYNQNTTQNRAVYPSPVYYTPPYGIQQNDYIKIGIQKTPNGQEFHIYQLKTGQKVAIAKGSGAPIVKTTVDIGSLDEEASKNGIAHLIEHSLFHGSKKYGDDLEKLEKNSGLESNAATGPYHTMYYYSLDSNSPEQLQKAIDMQADMILNPTFSKLEKEVPIVKKEIEQFEVDEETTLSHAVLKNLYSLQDFKTRDIIAGSTETIDNVTKEDMFNFHSMYYRPENFSTVVVSSSNPDDVIKMVSDSFSKAAEGKQYSSVVNRKTLVPTNNIKRYDTVSKESVRGEVLFAFAVPISNNAQESVNADALCKLLSLRTGFVAFSSKTNSQYSTIQVSSDLLDKNENEKLKELQYELNSILLSPPSDYELKQIKNSLLERLDGCYAGNQETSDFVANALTSKSDLMATYNAINNLTAENIVSALKYLDVNKCSMGVLHPEGTTTEEVQKKYNDSLTYITPTFIPKNTVDLDVRNAVQMYNIEPYSAYPAQSVVLPDNTSLVAVESKTDKCNVTWELYSPDFKNTNPALNMFLDKMSPLLGIDVRSKQNETGSSTDSDYSSKSRFKLTAECSASELAESIKNMKSLLDVDFSENAFKYAKQDVLDEIKSIRENAYDKRYEDINGGVYSCDLNELEAAVENLTLNDIKAHFNDIVNNAYSTVVVSAPFSKNPQLVNQVASATNIPNFSFKNNEAGMLKNTYSPKTKSNCYLAEEKVEQPKYTQTYSFRITGNSEDNVKFNLLRNVLYERLYADLREKQGLCYTPQSYYSNNGNTGEIDLSVKSSSTSREDIEKIFNSFSYIANSLASEDITEEELKVAKTKLKISIAEKFDDVEDAHGAIIRSMKNPDKLASMQNMTQIIDSITIDDIKTAAQYAFSEKPDYLIDASNEVLDANKDYFATLGEIK